MHKEKFLINKDMKKKERNQKQRGDEDFFTALENPLRKLQWKPIDKKVDYNVIKQ